MPKENHNYSISYSRNRDYSLSKIIQRKARTKTNSDKSNTSINTNKEYNSSKFHPEFYSNNNDVYDKNKVYKKFIR